MNAGAHSEGGLSAVWTCHNADYVDVRLVGLDVIVPVIAVQVG